MQGLAKRVIVVASTIAINCFSGVFGATAQSGEISAAPSSADFRTAAATSSGVPSSSALIG